MRAEGADFRALLVFGHDGLGRHFDFEDPAEEIEEEGDAVPRGDSALDDRLPVLEGATVWPSRTATSGSSCMSSARRLRSSAMKASGIVGT